jgi:hypothetical protein
MYWLSQVSLSTLCKIPLIKNCRFLKKRQFNAAFAFANHLSFNVFMGIQPMVKNVN